MWSVSPQALSTLFSIQIRCLRQNGESPLDRASPLITEKVLNSLISARAQLTDRVEDEFIISANEGHVGHN